MSYIPIEKILLYGPSRVKRTVSLDPSALILSSPYAVGTDYHRGAGSVHHGGGDAMRAEEIHNRWGASPGAEELIRARRPNPASGEPREGQAARRLPRGKERK